MICNFCNKPCNMTVRDSNKNLYNCCKECLEGFRAKKGECKYNVSVVYKEKKGE